MSDIKVYSSFKIWENVEKNAHEDEALISKEFVKKSDHDREVAVLKAKLDRAIELTRTSIYGNKIYQDEAQNKKFAEHCMNAFLNQLNAITKETICTQKNK